MPAFQGGREAGKGLLHLGVRPRRTSSLGEGGNPILSASLTSQSQVLPHRTPWDHIFASLHHGDSGTHQLTRWGLGWSHAFEGVIPCPPEPLA